MKIEKVDIKDLVSPIWNPRKISKKEMGKLKQSLTEFGYVAPIIVNKVNNHIVGGNKRLEALKELGYTSVDVVYIDEPNLEKEKALNVALNKVQGDWDKGKLEDLLVDLEFSDVDLDLTGFDDMDFREFNFNIRLPKNETEIKNSNPIIDEVIFEDDGGVVSESDVLSQEDIVHDETVVKTTNDSIDGILTVEDIKEKHKENLFDTIEYEDDTVTVFGEEPSQQETIIEEPPVKTRDTAKEPITEEFTIPVLEETSEEVYDLLVRFDDYNTREEYYNDLMSKGINCIRK